MVEQSWSWARSQGLVRENNVHGEEEARLVLVDSFHNENERGEMRNLRGEGDIEDLCHACFNNIIHNSIHPFLTPVLSPSGPSGGCRRCVAGCGRVGGSRRGGGRYSL